MEAPGLGHLPVPAVGDSILLLRFDLGLSGMRQRPAESSCMFCATAYNVLMVAYSVVVKLFGNDFYCSG